MSQLLKQPSSKFILRCPLRIARSTLEFRMVIHCPKQMRTRYATGRSSHECGLGRSSCWETPVDVTVDCGSNIVVILTPEIGEDGPRFIHVFQKGEGWLEFVSTNKLFLVSHQNSDSKNWWKLISVCASLNFWKSISLQPQNLSRILRQIWFSAASSVGAWDSKRWFDIGSPGLGLFSFHWRVGTWMIDVQKHRRRPRKSRAQKRFETIWVKFPMNWSKGLSHLSLISYWNCVRSLIPFQGT